MMNEEQERIAAYLRLFISPNQVTEIRAFGGGVTYSGVYDYGHIDSMALAAIELQRTCKGVYFVPNPIGLPPTNEVRIVGQGEAVKDSDIIRRSWLLIDVDPIRPTDVSATDDERREAWRVLSNVQASMEAAGFTGPVVASSGNGWHLTYPIDLPNDDQTKTMVRSLLKGLHQRHSTDKAVVDVKTYNAGRIWKLYGTRARKGLDSPDRPHRIAWVATAPDYRITGANQRQNNQALPGILTAWERQESAFVQLETQRASSYSSGVKRAMAYLAKMPPAISGQGGHNTTYHAAAIMVDGFGLSVDDAMAALAEWNARCQPPWTDKELRHKIEDAIKNCGPNRGRFLAQEPSRSKLQPVASYTGPDSVPETDRPDDDADATAADLIRQQATIQWAWPGWIQRGAITAIASDPGVGKTRFCADLLRRLSQGLPWPDGTPATYPAGAKAIWVAADSQWAELASLPQEMGFDPESLVLNGRKSNPYAGTNLDSIEDLAEFERRIKRVQPAIVFVDTCGSATDRNTTRPEEAKQFFKPLAEIATRCCVSIILVTHLSKSGEALGRRIVGACRQVIKLDHPDPAQANRRRLWVDKTNSKKPDPLGITMADAGNEYDTSPPDAPHFNDEPGRSKKQSGNLKADIDYLNEYLNLGARMVKDCIKDAETAGINIDRLYAAKRAMNIEQYTANDRQWWKLIQPEASS